MGLFKKKILEPANTGGDWAAEVRWLDWEPPLNLVRGEQHHRDGFESSFGTGPDGVFVLAMAELVRDPGNEFDPHAIRVERAGTLLGFIATELAAVWSPIITSAGDPQIVFPGVVRGGAPDIHYGIHIWPHRRLTPAPPFTLDPKPYKVPWPPIELHRL